MKKKSKQRILTGIIVIAIIMLALVVGYAIYEAKISQKEEVPNNSETSPKIEDKKDNTVADEKEENKPDEKEEYVGKEENESKTPEENVQITKEEKALMLAKEKWGEDDSVTFSIEEKKENIYYVAVKSNATVISWYEIDTNTWKISEFN